jgi:hypothetical protein
MLDSKSVSWRGLVLTSIVLFNLSAITARAEDFTFNVPVKVSNLHPDLKRGAVNCTVGGKENQKVGTSGYVYFPITNGGFDGIVPVKFNASPPSNNIYASSWVCSLNFQDNPVWITNYTSTWACDVMKSGGPYPMDPNVPCVAHQKGTISTALTKPVRGAGDTPSLQIAPDKGFPPRVQKR